MWLAGNSIGKEFTVTSFGESHGKMVGVVIDGCPSGLALCEGDVQADLDRRIPLQKPELVSGRVEKDVVQILSGVFNGFTTGAPICMVVENKQTRSTDYESLRDPPRPAHADYTATIRYGGFNDYRGGGRFSGRVTVAAIMAGAVAKKLLNRYDIDVLTYTGSIGKVHTEKEFTAEEIKEKTYQSAARCPDVECSQKMEETILDAKKAGDSVGGTVECAVLGVPVGVGEPLFDALDADLAKALFTVPAVKGIEFGAGFALTEMQGSEANDAFEIEENEVMTATNLAGGILGGISSGMPITLRVAIKPTPSIAQEQQTVSLSKRQNAKIKVGGRHDPCVVPKAVPAIEATVAIIIADHMIRAGFIPKALPRKQ
jgi:chorismate synthase